MVRAGRLTLLLLCSLGSGLARADVVFDGTLGTPGLAPAGVIGTTAVDYLIEPGRGALRGTNLFFSFERFSIESGRIGAFDGPVGIENVLARVTGGDVSRIDGLLGSAITGADVWLINPRGIVFGAGSELALRGDLHLSTGDYVRLADGTRFSADPASAGELSVAPPEAFGFLSTAPAAIDIDVSGPGLATGRGRRLALAAGDIAIHAGTDDQPGFLWAQRARIDMAAVASESGAPMEVRLKDASGDTLSVEGPWRGGLIDITRDAVVASTGSHPFILGGPSALDGAGDISFVADSLLLDDAEVRSQTVGAQRGGDIDVFLRGDLTLRGRGDETTGMFAGTGLTQGIVSIFGSGPGGNVAISARDVALLDGARLSTSSIGTGPAGSISIDAERVAISGTSSSGAVSAVFSSSTLSGAGGAVRIAADRLEMDARGAIVTEARTNASGGSIDIDVGDLSLRGGARIDSSVRSFVDPLDTGGTIQIRATRGITISGRESDEVFSGITAIAQGATATLPASTARAGDITIQTPRLGIADGGTISTQALGSGDGGTIEIWTGELAINGGILSASAVEGQGGDVRIHANGRVGLRGGSVITARADGPGDAGTIAIDAGRELVMERSAITSSSAESDGGDVSVRARELVALSRSEISTSVSGGTGGSITIDPEHVVLNRSQVVARAGAGTGGGIRIVAGQFIADVDSAVDASSETGIDGTVQIVSPDVDLTGTLDVLPAEFADAAELMRQACAAQRQAGDGSFVVSTAARAHAAPDAPLGERGEGEAPASCR